MKDLREFPDYRAYLKDCFVHEKANSRGTFSMKSFAEKLGLSDSSLRMILSGKRNLTMSNILMIAKALKMSFAQTEIFEAVVLRDQASSSHEKRYYEKKLNKFGSHDGPSPHRLKTSRISASVILTDPVIPEILVHLMDNKLQADKISNEEMSKLAQQFSVPFSKIQMALKQIQATGILIHTDQTTHLIFDKMSTTSARLNYLKQVFHETAEQIGKEPFSSRSLLSAKTLSISGRDIRSFGEDYKSLVESYMSKSDGDSNRTLIKVLFAAMPAPI